MIGETGEGGTEPQKTTEKNFWPLTIYLFSLRVRHTGRRRRRIILFCYRTSMKGDRGGGRNHKRRQKKNFGHLTIYESLYAWDTQGEEGGEYHFFAIVYIVQVWLKTRAREWNRRRRQKTNFGHLTIDVFSLCVRHTGRRKRRIPRFLLSCSISRIEDRSGGNGTTEDDRKKTLDLFLYMCSLYVWDTQREEGGE